MADHIHDLQNMSYTELIKLCKILNIKDCFTDKRWNKENLIHLIYDNKDFDNLNKSTQIQDIPLPQFDTDISISQYIKSPSNIPLHLPSNIPLNLPSNIPLNLPSNIPLHLPSNIPLNLPSNIPLNLPSNIPLNLPSNIPLNLHSNIQIN